MHKYKSRAVLGIAVITHILANKAGSVLLRRGNMGESLPRIKLEKSRDMSDIFEKLKKLQEMAKGVFDSADRMTHGWLGIVFRAAMQTFKPETSISAAALAYYALFSLFPIILVTIFIASFPLLPFLNQQSILNKLEFVAPSLGQLLGPNISHIVATRGTVTIVALVSLVWSGSTIFNMLNQTLSDLWGIKRKIPMWERRGLAILLVLVFAGPVLVLVSFASSMLSTVYSFLSVQFTTLTNAISLIVSIVLDIGLFAMFFAIFPHGKANWRELLPGAIAAGVLWELAKRAFLAFESSYLSTNNLIYGSVATIIAFLFWSYVSSMIFMFGAFLGRAYFRYKEQT
jgi:membrane protein